MQPVDAEELANLTTEAAFLFDKTATISRVTTDVQDSVGGRTQGTSTFTVACRLLHNDRRAEKTKQLPTDRAAVHARWTILVAVGTNLQLRDQVDVGGLHFTIVRSNHERSLVIFENATLNLIE